MARRSWLCPVCGKELCGEHLGEVVDRAQDHMATHPDPEEADWYRLVLIIEDEYGSQAEGYAIDEGTHLAEMQRRMHAIAKEVEGAEFMA